MPELTRDIDKLLAAMAKNESSDLHVKTGCKPIMRIAGMPHDVGTKSLTAEEIDLLLDPMMNEKQKTHLLEVGNVDLAYSISGVGRFRVNVFRQRGSLSAAIRRVNVVIPTTEQLHLPPQMLEFGKLRAGLVLVAGPTGSGKSTSLASLIEHINMTRRVHIITIEDPIEYMYRDKKAFINQREVGIDVATFHDALRSAVRQDPDVILCGEMRDAETFHFAITAAETGHLVFGTLHANSSAQCIGRVLDLFPSDQRDGIRQNMVFNLRAIVCQRLLPSIKQGVDRVPAVEIMINTPTVGELLRLKEDKKIQDAIKAGREDGMLDFNTSLVQLVNTGFIAKKTALQYSDNPEQLQMNLKGIYLAQDKGIV